MEPALSRLGGLCEITDCLYLSNARAANDTYLVQRSNISCIINVGMKNSACQTHSDIEYIHIAVVDSPMSFISEYFDQVSDKIHSVGLLGGRTVLHCNAGVSRSATLCLAYLIKHRKMSLVDAHRWLRHRRPIVRPNIGFWKQLIRYESDLRGCTTVKVIVSNIGEIPDIYEDEAKNMILL